MIFEISGFKCFDSVRLPLNKLTVLCGKNSAGKSTIIQALLLYRSAFGKMVDQSLSVNNQDGLSLGNADSVLTQNEHRTDDVIRIGFKDEQTGVFDLLELEAEVEGGERTERNLRIVSVPSCNQLGSRDAFFFNYLSAERNGPRISQELFSEDPENGVIGARGEFAAEVLAGRERQKIRKELLLPPSVEPPPANVMLLQALQEWMTFIVGPIEIRTDPNGNCPPSLSYKKPGVIHDWVVSTNTGFGISYTLPIVIAGLLAPIGGYLIVDSPEAHLHPAAQTALAKFLAKVASSGINVILETHSDHIVDGIRLATVISSIGLQAKDCSILNVYRDEDDLQRVETLNIEENGKLSHWPEDFFDQQTKNLRDIADAVRKAKATEVAPVRR